MTWPYPAIWGTHTHITKYVFDMFPGLEVNWTKSLSRLCLLKKLTCLSWVVQSPSATCKTLFQTHMKVMLVLFTLEATSEACL